MSGSVALLGSPTVGYFWNPRNGQTATMPNGVSFTSPPSTTCPNSGPCVWETTVTVPAGESITVYTQAVYTPCVGTGAVVTITVDDCNYQYPLYAPY